jgi:serine/threonine protein kinase
VSAIQIPGYKIIRTLGVGGQATVYLAIQQGFEREVALKVMSPALAADPSFGERFIREAKIVAQLSHSNIVTVYDVGQSGNFYYLAMEYLPGADLKTKIAEGIKTQECLDIISKVAVALHFAHAKGYIHRDVKSENILFNDKGDPLLTDFGIAKASNSSTQMTQTGKLIGTPEYMSPEQCRGKKIDGRSDLYSLGIILYEMLTRSVPFTGEDSVAVCIQHVTKPTPQLPARLKHLQWFVERLLAKDPEKRFQNGEQLISAITEFKSTTQGNTSEINFDEQSDIGLTITNPGATDVIDASSIDEFNRLDEFHTEKRPQISDIHPPSRAPKVLFVSIICIVAIGFFSKDYWFEQTYTWVEKNWLNKQAQLVDEKLAVDNKENNNSNSTNASDSSVNSKSKVVSKDPPTVDELLQQADRLVQFTPQKISDIKQAIKLIAAANTLEPNNQKAALVYQSVLNISLSEAKAQAEKNDFDSAYAWTDLVEYEQPKHQFLADTKKSIQELKSIYEQNQDKRIAQQRQVDEFLNKAKQAFENKRFSAPVNDNALYFYTQALSLSPNNQEAKQGLKLLSDKHVELIEAAIAKKSHMKAKSYLSKLSEITTDESILTNLKNKIRKSEVEYESLLKEKRNLAQIQSQKAEADIKRKEKLNDPLIQMKVAGNLDSAKRLEQEGFLVESERESALEKYRKVLELDKENLDAEAGVDRIESVIIKSITDAINQNNKSESLIWLDKLRLFDQYHPQLASYASQIETMVDLNVENNQESPATVENEPKLTSQNKSLDSGLNTSADNNKSPSLPEGNSTLEKQELGTDKTIATDINASISSDAKPTSDSNEVTESKSKKPEEEPSVNNNLNLDLTIESESTTKPADVVSKKEIVNKETIKNNTGNDATQVTEQKLNELDTSLEKLDDSLQSLDDTLDKLDDTAQQPE